MSDCPFGDPGCPCQDGDMCHYAGPNPMKLCRACEYFDADGQKGADFMGDCHNRNAPRFTTNANDTCPHFFLSTTGATP